MEGSSEAASREVLALRDLAWAREKEEPPLLSEAGMDPGGHLNEVLPASTECPNGLAPRGLAGVSGKKELRHSGAGTAVLVGHSNGVLPALAECLKDPEEASAPLLPEGVVKVEEALSEHSVVVPLAAAAREAVALAAAKPGEINPQR